MTLIKNYTAKCCPLQYTTEYECRFAAVLGECSEIDTW